MAVLAESKDKKLVKLGNNLSCDHNCKPLSYESKEAWR